MFTGVAASRGGTERTGARGRAELLAVQNLSCIAGNVVSFHKHRAVVLVWLLTNTQV
jgi:hypothetical protein